VKPPIYDKGCTLCPLHETATTVCMGARFSRVPEPGWHPKILFIGEMPGERDDRQGKPFMGDAGDLLSDALKQYGIHDYAITNVVKCYSGSPDSKPKAVHLKACAPYLDREIRRYKPEIVVPMGAVALKRLCGLDKVTEWAGRVYEPPGRDYKVYPIIHPSAVLRYETRFLQPFESQMRGLSRLASGARPVPTAYVRVTLREAIKRIKDLAETEGPYGFDIETGPMPGGSAHNPRFNRIVTAAFCPRKGEAFWFVWPTAQDEGLLDAFMRLLRSKATMVAHNAMFEIKHVRWHIVQHAGVKNWEGFSWRCDDSLLLYHLLHEDAKGYYGLDHVRREVLPDMGDYDAEVMALVNAGTAHHLIDIDMLGTYNAGDADACFRACEVLKRQVFEKRGLKRAYETVVQPAMFSVARAELAGRKIDFDQVAKLHEQFQHTERTAGLAMRTHKAVRRYCADTGRDIADWNPGSSAQVAPIIFDYLGLEVLGRTEGGKASIQSKYIEPYKAKSRFVREYLSWKEAKTLDNNYLTPYMAKVASDGFLYGGYLLFGTATGRLASVSPNLQNFAPILRTAVVSRFVNGFIVSADYSQLELRLMAFESSCPALLDAYAEGQDVHALTATHVCSKLFDREVTLAEVADQHQKAEESKTQSWRQDYGKRPNFALLYGAFPKRFSQEFHVDLRTAEVIHRAFHEAYPEVGAFLRKVHAQAQERGWIESRFGRRRRLPLALGDPPFRTEGWWLQKAAFREASNFPIQSLGSDINTTAFARVQAQADEAGIPYAPLGMTHDSQDYDMPESSVGEFAPLLRRVMVKETHQLYPWLGVPLDIDIKVGRSWGTLTKWKAS
jgi:DNA polymerase I